MTTQEQALLDKVKTSLRISHTALDEDVLDSIRACLADLQGCGVRSDKVDIQQGLDPLILNAVKIYCKEAYTDDTAKAARYREGYDRLKAFLQMAGPYQCTEEAAADE